MKRVVIISFLDINKAVDALGELFSLKIGQIRYNLLNHWLGSSSSEMDFDCTLAVANVTKLSANTDDNLKKRVLWYTTLVKSLFIVFLGPRTCVRAAM